MGGIGEEKVVQTERGNWRRVEMKKQKEKKTKQKSPKHSFPCEVSTHLQNLISQRASVPLLNVSAPGEQHVNRQELFTCINSRPSVGRLRWENHRYRTMSGRVGL